ncbi:carboxylesterase [Fusarium oxysporum f. sp. phaseoli]
MPYRSSCSPHCRLIQWHLQRHLRSALSPRPLPWHACAKAPVNDLRLRVSQSLNSPWTGIRNATKYSPSCIGYDSDTWVLGNHVSEDCLSINVVRPAGLPEGAKLPVAVWIHGGGWVNGGSSDPRYSLSFIVEQSVSKGMPIMAASMNHRLHAWGFIHSAELAAEGSTNLGYRDQRLALHWIKENIANFGGDPERVTLWGESAGAFSVGSQLVAYGGRVDKLFKPVACLRKLPTNELSAVLNSSFASPPSWGQVVDGDFIPASGRALLKKGKFAKVPLLMGTNFDEGTEFVSQGVNTTSQFAQYVRSVGVAKPAVNSIEKLYSNNPAVGIPGTLKGRPEGHLAYLGQQYKRAAAFSGDVFQHAGRRLTTQSWPNSIYLCGATTGTSVSRTCRQLKAQATSRKSYSHSIMLTAKDTTQLSPRTHWPENPLDWSSWQTSCQQLGLALLLTTIRIATVRVTSTLVFSGF